MYVEEWKAKMMLTASNTRGYRKNAPRVMEERRGVGDLGGTMGKSRKLRGSNLEIGEAKECDSTM